jgi:hypothetical protein
MREGMRAWPLFSCVFIACDLLSSTLSHARNDDKDIAIMYIAEIPIAA